MRRLVRKSAVVRSRTDPCVNARPDIKVQRAQPLYGWLERADGEWLRQRWTEDCGNVTRAIDRGQAGSAYSQRLRKQGV